MKKTIIQKRWDRIKLERNKALEKYRSTVRYIETTHKQYYEFAWNDTQRSTLLSYFNMAFTELLQNYRVRRKSIIMIRRSIRIMDQIIEEYDANVIKLFGKKLEPDPQLSIFDDCLESSDS